MKEIKVTSMNCNHCVKKISDALAKANIKAEVVLEKKLVKVDDADVNEAKIVITEAGHMIAD